MFRAIVLSFSLALSSAASATGDELPYKKFLISNAAGVSQLAAGMPKEQVIALMGNHKSKVHDTSLNNPYRTEMSQRGSDTYEVLYYLTRRHPPYTPILDAQAVPIVLKNGVVVGWGKAALHSLNQ